MVYRSWRCTSVPGWDLDYFKSKEWLDVQDRLDELESKHIVYNPVRTSLFRALERCSFTNTNVAFFGQDPYPKSKDATGVAFSAAMPGERRGSPLHLPPTLQIIHTEYVHDLEHPYPTHGCLEAWCDQGVLLWNVIPTCQANVPASHRGWPWSPLTIEITERLSAKGKIIFVFCGHKAQEYAKYVDQYNNQIIYTSHPSPRGQLKATDKFIGSRLFTTINAKLIHYLKEPIDWRLD